MAQKTTLGALGLPSPIHVFLPKTPAIGGGPHNPGRITTLNIHGTPGKTHDFSSKGGGHDPGHITSLAVYGVPGALHSFAPKTPADGGPHDPSRITALSVYGVPGKTQSFDPKAPAVPPGEKGEGLFTTLSPSALPGARYSFEAKEGPPPIIPPPPPQPRYKLHGFNKRRTIQGRGRFQGRKQHR